MAQYAAEKLARGLCDRCGFEYELKTLRYLTIRTKKTNLRVCEECWEPDHPQNKQGLVPVYDPQALENPRPDPSLASIRGLFAWDPVGVTKLTITLGLIGVS
jgi:hypothetical protein